MKGRPKAGRKMQLLNVLAKGGYVALKQEAEDGYRIIEHRAKNLLYNRILGEWEGLTLINSDWPSQWE